MRKKSQLNQAAEGRLAWLLPTFRVAAEAIATHRVMQESACEEFALLINEAQEHIHSLGWEVERVLRVSPEKTRCAILCKHPKRGRSVYKSVSIQAPSGKIRAHTESVRLVASSGGELFPTVYHIGSTFSLEEYVEGNTLHELPTENWYHVDLLRLFERLRRFREGDPMLSAPIGPNECKLIIFKYVRKILRSSKYAVLCVRPLLLLELLGNKRLAELLHLTLQKAERLQLPRSYVCDDLTPANIMVSPSLDRLCVVDVEHITVGFSGFDCLWLLAMLTRTQCPPHLLERLYSELCTDRFWGFSGANVLMSALLGFQLELLSTYIRPHQLGATARALLARVQEDLAKTKTFPHRNRSHAYLGQ